MTYSSGATPTHNNRGTIAVVPNQKYSATFEILRNDLEAEHEYVTNVIIGQARLGACRPDGGERDCTFYDCSSEQRPVIVSSTTAQLAVLILIINHSSECHCDTATWACMGSKEDTVAGHTPMTAVGRVTLVPLSGTSQILPCQCCRTV